MAKTITINAADLPADSEAKFREVLVPYEENEEVKAKKAFVLCCEPDGNEVSIGGEIEVKMSIVKDSEDSKLKLDGDVESPGVYYVYGTNSSGEKGWLEGVTVDL